MVAGKTRPHAQVMAHLGGRKVSVELYKRDDLFANATLQTPCIVSEYSATTLIPDNSSARVDQFGNLLIDTKEHKKIEPQKGTKSAK